MELRDDRVLHLALHHLLVVVLLREVEVEPRLERFEVVEDVGQQEVEQRPQLGQIVLERRPREQQPVAILVHRNRLQLADETAIHVLQPMALVDDHELPPELPQLRNVADDNLVRRDHHGEDAFLLLAEILPAQRLALFLGTVIDDGLDARRPMLELALPVVQRRQRPNHQERPGNILLPQMREHRDRLHRLPELSAVESTRVTNEFSAIVIAGSKPAARTPISSPRMPFKPFS